MTVARTTRRLAVLTVLSICALPLFAGSTGTTALHTPQGSGAATANGDYVTSSPGALNTLYRYFIEVPPGLARLVVEIFDADIGRGGATEDTAGRDRDRNGYDTQADYSLIRPDGTTAATLSNCDDNTCNDNVWTTLLNSTTAQNTAAGHWELRVDMSSSASTGGDDINAIGIRAHDGNSDSAGTELNIYADSMVSLGSNPPASGTMSRSYTLHPYITSGCSCSQNDFDFDSNRGTVGSVAYSNRSGTFTQSLASATLSGDNVWNRDAVSGWTSDDKAVEYGIWSLAATVNSYLVTGTPNGNYTTLYAANFAAGANPPTSNPAANAFRLYLPTDGAAAPVKPFLEQVLSRESGPVFAVGKTDRVTVTIRVENPTPRPIVFSAANLVTANVPGSGAVYAGNAQVTQGSIVSTPSVGGTGNVVWNPGTVAAGVTATMAYNVNVTPVSAGQRIPVTATPASGNGTRARFVDETGNTTQARATYTLGPLCELAITEGLVTEVMLGSFEVSGRGVQWTTASEAGTVGFNVYREDGTRVNDALIASNPKGRYRVDDRMASPDARYFLEEVMASGRVNRIGPLNRLDRVSLPNRVSVSHAAPERRGAKKAVAVMAGVARSGVVRIAASDLAAAFGASAGAIQGALRSGNLSVTDRDNPVAWSTAGDALLFFAEKPDSVYSNERVYRIELARGVRMTEARVAPAAVPVSAFVTTHEAERDVFAATALPLDPQSDYWFQEFFVSGDADNGRKTIIVDVPAVAGGGGNEARLDVRLQGAIDAVAHRASISLNGIPLGDARWSGLDAKTASFAIPAAALHDGANEIAIEGLLEPDTAFDIFYLDGFTVRYERFARPDDGQIEVRRGGAIAAGPFSSPPLVLDLSNRTRPVLLSGASFMGGNASLTARAGATSILFTDTFVAPSFLRASAERTLKKSAQRADWIAIAPRAMRAGAEALARLREREGMAAMVVDLEQIYDEFAGGNVTPLAIRDFIRSTASWPAPPRYVVLAGAGTVDYRGIDAGPGPLPPLMARTRDGLYAADSLFADFDGDALPDLAIGRIPVTSSAELQDYADKLEANAIANASDSRVVFAADATDRAADFRRVSAHAEEPLASRPLDRLYVDDLGASSVRASLLDVWSRGVSLVSWIGHGGHDQWSPAGVLTSFDAPSLTSSGTLPVVVAMTCTINRFENGFVEPLGAALTRARGAGATAVWSSSGLSAYADADTLERTFMQLAARKPGSRIGDLIVESLASNPSETASVYLLLGDPALRLSLPDELRNTGEGASTTE